MTGSEVRPWLGRLTPYELVFEEGAFEEDIFPAIRREAESQGVNPALREQFGFLPAVGDLVRKMVPDDATPELLEQYRHLLYQGFNFWLSGRMLLSYRTEVVRYLVETTPALSDWDFVLPAQSVYLQLPAHLFWAQVAPDVTPEAVDGIFLTAVSAEDPVGPPYRRVNGLMILGLRPDRAGFSVAPFDTEVGEGMPAEWMAADGRREGNDFENILPGGDLSGLYAIETAGEAFKLMGALAWYADAHEDAVGPAAPVVWKDDNPPMRRSRLDVSFVELSGG